MLGLTCLLMIPGQIETVESPDFSAKAQTAALAATVRIVNVSRESSGCGVVIGRKGDFVYVLTARHVVDKADRLEVVTFSSTSYPKPEKVYRTASVVAQSNELRDLALIRLTTSDPMPGVLALCPVRLIPNEKGFKALAVGCTQGGPPTGLIDVVSGKKLVRKQAEGEGASFWELEKEQKVGRSGGPLVENAVT